MMIDQLKWFRYMVAICDYNFWIIVFYRNHHSFFVAQRINIVAIYNNTHPQKFKQYMISQRYYNMVGTGNKPAI